MSDTKEKDVSPFGLIRELDGGGLLSFQPTDENVLRVYELNPQKMRELEGARDINDVWALIADIPYTEHTIKPFEAA